MCVRVCVKRYGLWDHEGPLEEENPSSENQKDEAQEGDGDGKKKKKKGGGGEKEDEKASSTSNTEMLEVAELEKHEKVGAKT